VSATLRVPITELRRRLGTRRPVQRTVSSDDVHDLTGVAGTVVTEAAELVLDLTLESVPEGVMVTGTITAPWTGSCRRCLDLVTGEVDVAIHELFEPDPTPGDTYPLDDDVVDLGPMVRDAVLLALPLSVLCREDCAGPDPDRFPTSVEDEAPPADAVEASDDEGTGDAPTGDPRWAALRDLRFEE
jgi:uncharacterized protein